MTEAWLLTDTLAIRRAAGNPNGTAPLGLPSIRDLEDVVDPKGLLHESIRVASGLSGRRLRSFRPEHAARRVPQYTPGFASLRALPAFLAFESDLSSAMPALAAQPPAV